MLAAVLYDVEDLRVEYVDEPRPAPGEVKLKVAACGICGSDLHLYRGAGLRQGAVQQRLVLGHEFSGEVVETCGEVGTVREGDLVTVRPTVSCGQCAACRSGAVNVCRALRFYGVSAPLDGGLAEYAVVPASNVHQLPAGLDPVLGALAEPLAVGYHAVARSGAQPGDSVVIYGGGPIGISIMLCLHARGVRDVFVIEPAASRRAAVASLGPAQAWDPGNVNVRAAVQALTQGRGADVAFESSGHPNAFTDAQRVTARQGHVVIVAAYEKPVTFDPYFLLSTEQTMTAALAYTPAEFGEVLDRMGDGTLSLTGWVNTISLVDVLADGFAAAGEQRAAKILVVP